MAYQFVHIDTFAPKLRKVKGTEDQFNNTEQVFGEAERDPRYSGHVTDPLPPVPLMDHGGLTVAELRALHDKTRATIRETVPLPDGRSYTRRLKSDFPTLYTEIHSHPMTAEDYRKASPEEQAEVTTWAERALADFLQRMPKNVKFAAVMHLDEGHVHIHILAVNIEDPKLSANKLHVGKLAAEVWRAENGPAETLTSQDRPELAPRPKKPKKPKPSTNRVTQKKREAEHAAALAKWEEACETVEAANATALKQWETKNNAHLHTARKERKSKTGDVEAYEAAMKKFQDDYYETVGKPCGLLRHGPGNERLSTVQYAERKAHAKRQAKAEAELQEKQEALAREQANAAEKLAEREKQLQADSEALTARETAVDDKELAANLREETLNETEAYQQRERKRLTEQAKEQKQAADRLKDDRQKFRKARMEADEALTSRSSALAKREAAVAEREQEAADAVDAIGDLVGQMERGEIRIDNEKFHLETIPRFLQRMLHTRPAEHSPLQKLVSKFVGLLKRAVTVTGGGPEVTRDEPEDRLEM